MSQRAPASKLRRLLPSAVFALALVLGAIAFREPLARWFTGKNLEQEAVSPAQAPSAGASAAASVSGDIDHYTCSMHPSVKQAGPGKCPICGMDLVPVTKEQQRQGVVMIDDARRQLIGVRTEAVSEAPLRRSFRAVGQVTYDESKLTDVVLKVQGFVTKLFVNQTGQRVSSGQPLLLLYSPELYNAQQDFLLATRGNAALAAGPDAGSNRVEYLGQAARQRLHLLGLADAQIDAIAKNGAPLENVAILSPASGFVIEKNVVQGASVDAGVRLFRIAALSEVWVEADVYEGDLAHVRAGQSVDVTLDYLPGQKYAAKVAYIYPYIDPKARTGRVRVVLANRKLDLRPGMYASVEIAADPTPKLQVPASAVVYTGPRRLVFIDLGQGRFRPQEIRVGTEADGKYEVLEGLHAGDIVATSGVFLIAAEARISTAAKYWESSSDLTPPNDAAPSLAVDAASAAPVDSARPNSSPVAPKPAVLYSCPMHPEVISPSPGKCPKCGMDLEPMRRGTK